MPQGAFRMYYSSTIFSQLLGFLPKNRLKRFVGQHQGDRYVKKMTVWNQLVILMYAQATGKESLREIETGLQTHPGIWHHLGIQTVAKSTVARVNNTRSSKIFENLFYATLEQCKDTIPKRNFTFDNPLYSLDSTTISLCLSMFDWAHHRSAKGAVKIHTLLNNRSYIPELLNISTGKMSDVTAAKIMNLSIPRGSIVVFDRGYLDYEWWKTLEDKGIFFVTRPRVSGLCIVSNKHREPQGSILSDDVVWVGDILQARYPKQMRRVKYLNDDGKIYEYLTNNFILTGEEIALVYKERWQIELFFKWIKQNLKIKSFLGTSENAVLSQIWIAMTFYLILSYVKFQTKFDRSLLELTRMVRETLFTRRSLIDLLSLSPRTVCKIIEPESEQMRLVGV
jgi:hypothetical protein